jgi:hypothetical protein
MFSGGDLRDGGFTQEEIADMERATQEFESKGLSPEQAVAEEYEETKHDSPYEIDSAEKDLYKSDAFQEEQDRRRNAEKAFRKEQVRADQNASDLAQERATQQHDLEQGRVLYERMKDAEKKRLSIAKNERDSAERRLRAERLAGPYTDRVRYLLNMGLLPSYYDASAKRRAEARIADLVKKELQKDSSKSDRELIGLVKTLIKPKKKPSKKKSKKKPKKKPSKKKSKKKPKKK